MVKSNTTQKSNTRKKAGMATVTLVTLALLTALGVICSLQFPAGLTFRVGGMLKFSPSFIVIAIAARKYGAFASALVAALIDIIQAFFSTTGFSFNPLISLSAVVTGVLFGLFLHKNVSLPRIILAVLSTQIVCSLGLTTLGLMVYYSTLFPMFYWRMLQVLIYTVIEIPLMYVMFIKPNILKRIKLVND